MIHHVYIERNQRYRLCFENQSILQVCEVRKIPYDFFTEKQIYRRQLPLTTNTLVVGYLPTVTSALKQLGVPLPEPNDYPLCLRHLLYRRIWLSKVRDVRDLICNEASLTPFFAKPFSKNKRFTGCVVQDHSDLYKFNTASESMKVWCAERVKWQSEFRPYIANGQLLEMLHYDGDATIRPDEQVVLDAIRLMSESSENRAGYALDVGVLDTGVTALVECNDGYGLGTYGLEDDLYFELISARWLELVSTVQQHR